MNLRLEHIDLTLNGADILSDLSLEVEDGSFVSLLGHSGAGKTSTLKVIAGITVQNNGHVFFGDEIVDRLPAYRRKTSILFQDIRLFPHMNVRDNIAFPLRIQGVGKQERGEQAEQLLELVHLAGMGQRRIDQISGGQQQRVALARAIAPHPRYLLLDEPFSGLDEGLRNDMRKLVRELHDTIGLTTILVTHNAGEALELSDRIFYMAEGRIAQEGTPQKLYERPKTGEIARCFGDCSELMGTVTDGIFTAGPFTMDFSDYLSTSESRHGLASVIIRKSALCITEENDPTSIALAVSSCRYQGSSYENILDVGGQNLILTTLQPLTPETVVRVRLEPNGCFIYPQKS